MINGIYFVEPRGLIRFLQFIFAICAFATACNGGSSIKIQATDTKETTYGSWAYPYNLQNAKLTFHNGSSTSISTANDIKPSAEFFVFTGVTSMLLSLAFLVVYVFLDRQYRNNDRLPLADFVSTIIWMIFWLAGSAAWAKGVSNIRSLTDYDSLRTRFSICQSAIACELVDGKILFSIVFSFVKFIVL